jgi:thiol-disulfide isomerase/thioredoxin
MIKAPLRIVPAIALLALAGAAAAQVDEAAKAKLQAAHDTVKAATSYSYHCQMKGTGGMMEAMLPEMSSEVVMVRDPQTKEWVGKIYGARAPKGDVAGANFAIYTRGNLRIWIDDENKQVLERPLEQAAGNEQVQSATSASLRELMLPEPFATALTSTTITAEAPITLDGVQCDVIYTDPGENQTKFRYVLGPDHMPRRVDQIIKGGGLDMSQAWTLTNVKVNTPIPMDDVKVRVPQGYTLIPAYVPPAPTPPATAGSTTVPPPPVRQVGTQVNDIAPDFDLAAPDGSRVTLVGLKGNVVVLDFWGTWCIPCQKAAPMIEALHQKYKDRGVKIFGLAIREANDQNPINYMKEHNLTYGLLLQADSVARTYRVRLFPTYVVIGRDGSIAHITSKNKEDEISADLTEAIEKALGGGKPGAAPKSEGAAGDKPAPASPAAAPSGASPGAKPPSPAETPGKP